MRCTTTILAFGVMLAASLHLEGQTKRQTDERVKVAVVLQLARFVEWPAETWSPGEPSFRLCVLGKDRWIPLLQETAREETVGGRPVAVQRLARAQEARGCQVLVVGGPLDRDTFSAVSHLKLLTVGEEEGFARAGGMVNLTVENGRVGFELNVAAAEIAGLRFSSKVLRLARVVATSEVRRP